MLSKSRSLEAFLLAAALSVGAAAQDARFDQSPAAPALLKQARQSSKIEPGNAGSKASPDDALWVSIGRADLKELARTPFSLGAPVLSSEQVSVFRVDSERLPNLSRLMHERFGRCGGFFAHETQEEAAADLRPAASATAGPYTLDQQDLVKPLMQRVREAELKSTIETLAAYNNRYYQAESGVEAARWIKERWQTLAAAIPGASAKLVNHERWKQPSVVLTIPGTDKADEIVVLGGHLDSISGWGNEQSRAPGADDDASGIAVLTEAVRILGESGLRPRRTIEVMGYAAEEVGLRGSKDLAQQYANKQAKVVGVIQFDMTNFKGSAEDIYLLEDYVDPALTAFLGRLIEAYVGVRWSKTRCGYGCSDHASWTRSGFAASLAFESSFENYNDKIHSNRDTLGNSGGNAEHSVNFAKLALAFAVELAKTAPTTAR
jgi:leucyl aminopeptidase